MLVRQDFVGCVGLAKTISVTLNDGPYTLSTSTLEWRLALSPDGDAVFEKTVGSGITVTDEATDTLQLDVAVDDIDEPGLYYHSLTLTPSGGSKREVASGRGLFRGRPGVVPS